MVPPADLVSSLKDNAWIASLILVFIAVFRNWLQAVLTKALNKVSEIAYNRLAGSRILRKKALSRYSVTLAADCAEIKVPFRPNRPLPLKDLYIDLKVAGDGASEPIPITDELRRHKRIVVTGPPGAGKSMFLRHTAVSELLATPRRRGPATPMPVLVELHRLGGESDTATVIEDHLVSSFERHGFPNALKFVHAALESGSLMLLFDGLDEVPREDRSWVIKRVNELLQLHKSCPALITCRTAVYRGDFDASADRVFELEPFRDDQVEAFISAWPEAMPAGKSPEQLMAVLRNQPKLLSAARNPLLLTIMTHLYSDRPTYRLPRSRADFYRQAATILLDQWQGQLNQNAFEAAEKDQVLRHLAIHMLDHRENEQVDRRTIRREAALEAIAEVMPRLGRDSHDVDPILREIVERSGLLLKIDGGQRYAFAHLTFQEYFAAEALLEQQDRLVHSYAADPDSWREVVKLWCGLATDCTTLVNRVAGLDFLTAIECIAEARAIDDSSAGRLLDEACRLLQAGEADELTQYALAAVAADARPRGNTLLKRLADLLPVTQDPKVRRDIAVALSTSNRGEAVPALIPQLLADHALVPAVTALGDISVPALVDAAIEIHANVAIECLGRIGTPRAAAALVSLMTVESLPSPLGSLAAWHILSLIRDKRVRDALNRHSVSMRLSEGLSDFHWVWRPFEGDTPLTGVVIHAMSMVVPFSEPPPCVPCEVVSAALATMGFLRIEKFAIDRDTEARLYRLGLEALGAQPLLNQLERKYERPPQALLAAAVLGDQSARRSSGDGFNLDGPFPNFVDELLDTIGRQAAAEQDRETEAWAAIARALPRSLRVQLFARLGGAAYATGIEGPRQATAMWSAICNQLSYRFDRSTNYLLMLASLVVLSFLAFTGAASIIEQAGGLNGTVAWVALFGCLEIVGAWLVMKGESSGTGAYAGIESTELYLACLGIFAGPLIIGEAIKQKKWPDDEEFRIFTVFGFAPAVIWLAFRAVTLLVPTAVAVPVLTLIVLVMIFLAVRGERRQQQASSPLLGLFAHGPWWPTEAPSSGGVFTSVEAGT